MRAERLAYLLEKLHLILGDALILGKLVQNGECAIRLDSRSEQGVRVCPSP